MVISNLIKELQEVQEIHGDIQVGCLSEQDSNAFHSNFWMWIRHKEIQDPGYQDDRLWQYNNITKRGDKILLL